MSLLDYIIGALPLEQTFLVGNRMVIDGSFTCTGSGIVIGRINGSISTDGNVTIAKKGFINGSVKAANLIVKGTITGNIYCDGKMTVAAGAYIKGDIITGEIAVEKSALIDGSIAKLVDKDIAEIEDFIAGLTTPINSGVVVNNEIAIKSSPSEDVPKEKAAQTWF